MDVLGVLFLCPPAGSRPAVESNNDHIVLVPSATLVAKCLSYSHTEKHKRASQHRLLTLCGSVRVLAGS